MIPPASHPTDPRSGVIGNMANTPGSDASRAWDSPVLAPSILAALRRFFEAWGHQAIVLGGCVWFDGGSFSLMSIPSSLFPKIDESAVREGLLQTRKLVAVYPGVGARGVSVPLFVLRDKTYGPQHLQRQFRQQVRTATSRLEARACSWKEWQESARRCDRETLARRGKPAPTNHPLLTSYGRERIVAAASDLPELRIHACFHGREIVAYLVHLTQGSVCEGLMAHRCDAGHPSPARYASHLLFHSFASKAIADEGVETVCVGRQSVPANPTLARFKRNAGFTAEMYGLHFQLHPWLTPWLENEASARVLRMIRTHASGRLPALLNLEVLEHAALRKSPSTPPRAVVGSPPGQDG